MLLPFFRILVAVCAWVLTTAAFAEQQKYFELDGHWQQGGLQIGRLLQPGEIWVGERQLNISDDGRFVFGFGRDHQKDFSLTFVDAKGNKHTFRYQIQPRTYNIQKIEGVQKKHVSPPPETLDRIRAEAKRVKAARKRNDLRDHFSQPFIWPLVGPITGVYGSQRIYNGVPKSPHYGLDIAAPKGTKVIAPAPGVVTLAEADLYYSGGTLIMDHGHGLSSTFIHLSSVLVDVGQNIKQGQVIAEVGASGRATGPHLDWRMNWFGERVDPQLLMSDTPMPDKK